MDEAVLCRLNVILPPSSHVLLLAHPIPATGFHEGTLGGQAQWRVLEMVCAAVRID